MYGVIAEYSGIRHLWRNECWLSQGSRSLSLSLAPDAYLSRNFTSRNGVAVIHVPYMYSRSSCLRTCISYEGPCMRDYPVGVARASEIHTCTYERFYFLIFFISFFFTFNSIDF